MIILSLNCGSSSAKYRLYDYDKKETLATGIVERVTIGKSYIQQSGLGREPIKIDHECPTHREAIKLIIDTLLDPKIGVLDDLAKISAVGHRVVHGGEKFTKSVKITPETLETFKSLFSLAPLHNPPNVLGIEAALDVLPNVPHVAIMDTAWHQTMPASSYIYALPYEWYEKYGVRRYGFHGTSFLYVAKRAAVLLGKDPFKCNLVCLHIGNGVSANAIKNGVSYRHDHGPDPPRGPGHGHAGGRPRRGHRPHGHGEGGHRPGQDERHPQQEVGPARDHRQVHRPPRRPEGRRGGRRPGQAGHRGRVLPDQEVHRRLLGRARRRGRHRLHGRRRRDVRPHPGEVAARAWSSWASSSTRPRTSWPRPATPRPRSRPTTPRSRSSSSRPTRSGSISRTSSPSSRASTTSTPTSPTASSRRTTSTPSASRISSRSARPSRGSRRSRSSPRSGHKAAEGCEGLTYQPSISSQR